MALFRSNSSLVVDRAAPAMKDVGRSATPRHLAPESMVFDALGALTMYFALVYFVPARWVLPGFGAAGRPAALFGIGLLLFWCAAVVLPETKVRRTPLRWPVLFFILSILTSYALAYDRGLPPKEALAADRGIFVLLSTVGVLLAASEGLPTVNHVERLVKRIVYMSSIIVGVGLIQFIFKFDIYARIRFPGLVLNNDISGLTARGSGGFVRVKGSMLHPIEFGVAMGMALPLAVHLALHEADRVLRRRKFGLVALHGAAGALAVSRSAVVASGVAVVVLLWAWAPKVKALAMLIGVAFLAVMRLAIPGLLGTIRSLFENWGSDPSIQGRTKDYEIVAQYVAQRPWFGRGLNTFLPSEYILLDNAYLGLMVSTGYVGLSSFLGLILAGLLFAQYCRRTHLNNGIRHLAVAVSAVILVGAVSAGTFDLLAFQSVYGLLLVGIGIAAALAFHGDGGGVKPWSTAPAGLLRVSYRAGYVRSPWWHRFDPELANGRWPYRGGPPTLKSPASSPQIGPVGGTAAVNGVADNGGLPQTELRVMQLPVSSDTERQPYIALLERALSASDQPIQVEPLRVAQLLRNRPDVVHIHWPEHLLGKSLKQRVRALAVLTAIRIAKFRGTRVVLTAHNLNPHDKKSSAVDRYLLAWFDGMVDIVTVMSLAGGEQLRSARPRLGAEQVHVRHGDFRALFADLPSRESARHELGLDPNRRLVAFVGQVRPYKGIPELLSATEDLDVDVMIAGRCNDERLRSHLERSGLESDRLKLKLDFLTNRQLGQVLRAADLVVLPYRQVFNSGSALLALSAGRRVLLPATATFEELAEEVGRSWVCTFEPGSLSSSDISEALEKNEPASEPDLGLYSWDIVESSTVFAYRCVSISSKNEGIA